MYSTLAGFSWRFVSRSVQRYSGYSVSTSIEFELALTFISASRSRSCVYARLTASTLTSFLSHAEIRTEPLMFERLTRPVAESG